MQQMGLDILPPGAADSYEQYLGKVKESMEHLIQETGNVAGILDNHDENTFTKNMQEVLRKLAVQAETTAYSTKEITEELLRKLEEKNDSVGSRTQEEYIDQIRGAAAALEDLEPYKDCDLSGTDTFTEEDKEEIQMGLGDLTDEWETAIEELKRDAEDFSQENVQNELSGIYLLLAQQMEGLLQKMADIVEPVGVSLDERADNVSSRRTEMEQTAEELFAEAITRFEQELEETAEKFTDIVF